MKPAHQKDDQARGTGAGARPWLIATLAFALLYGLLALRLAFHDALLVQDDARQHVFWMRRFLDPGLFPNDLIADYFQSVAPSGYSALYWVFAKVGVDPLVLSKILPALVGVLTAYLAFRVMMEIVPSPRAAFMGSLLLNQCLWMKDDVISATPRAFVYPIFLFFLLCLLRRSLIPCLIAIALEAVFYPQSVFVSAGVLVLSLFRWEAGKPRLSKERSDYVFCGAGLVVAAAVMLPFVLSASSFGPVVRGSQARTMPEFFEEGRSSFFIKGYHFWYDGPRSGFMPRALFSPFMWAGFLLPILWARRSSLRLVERAGRGVGVLARIVVASMLMWGAAHLLLFKLHLPSRYSQWSLRIVIMLAAGLVLGALWEWAETWIARQQEAGRRVAARAAGAVVAVTLIAIAATPHFSKYPDNTYVRGNAPALYSYLRTLPKDIVIASISPQVDLLPTFAQRSILAGREYAIPYHLGYYGKLRERGAALFRTQYSPNIGDVKAFDREYGVSYWLIDRSAFTTEYVKRRAWFKQLEPSTPAIIQRLQDGEHCALAGLMDTCKVWENRQLALLSADLIEKASEAPGPKLAGYALPQTK